MPEEEVIEGQADERRHDHDRDHEGREPGPVLVLRQEGEHERGGERLRPEGEVEDAGGLIGQDETDRHDGVGAPIRNARQGETEEVLHRRRCRFVVWSGISWGRGCRPATGTPDPSWNSPTRSN